MLAGSSTLPRSVSTTDPSSGASTIAPIPGWVCNTPRTRLVCTGRSPHPLCQTVSPCVTHKDRRTSHLEMNSFVMKGRGLGALLSRQADR